MILFDKWGKYKLAYPIKKNMYGVYFLMRFDVDNDGHIDILKNMDEFFKVKATEVVSRAMSTCMDLAKSLEYQKPLSLEDTPAGSGDVDKFLRDNKMTGFLGKDKKREEASRAPKAEEKAQDVVNEKPEAKKAEEKSVEKTEEKTEKVAEAEESGAADDKAGK